MKLRREIKVRGRKFGLGKARDLRSDQRCAGEETEFKRDSRYLFFDKSKKINFIAQPMEGISGSKWSANTPRGVPFVHKNSDGLIYPKGRRSFGNERAD